MILIAVQNHFQNGVDQVGAIGWQSFSAKLSRSTADEHSVIFRLVTWQPQVLQSIVVGIGKIVKRID